MSGESSAPPSVERSTRMSERLEALVGLRAAGGAERSASRTSVTPTLRLSSGFESEALSAPASPAPMPPPLEVGRSDSSVVLDGALSVAGESPSRASKRRRRSSGDHGNEPADQRLVQVDAALDSLLSESAGPEGSAGEELRDKLRCPLLREVQYKLDQLHYRVNLPNQRHAVNKPLGETLYARTWPELMRLLELNSWERHNARYTSPFLFRGLPNVDFRMLTSLQRLGHPLGSRQERRVEKGILRAFLNYCHGALGVHASVFEWWALGQHHECPTRILDFSYSPFIAMHFATRDPSKDDADGVIWCVDPRRCLEASDTYRATYNAWKRESTDDYWAICRTNQFLSLLDFAAFANTAGSSAASARTFQPGADHGWEGKLRMLEKLPLVGDSLVFMEAPDLHERVRNQNHVFAFLAGKTQCIDDWLEQRKHMHTHRKIVISRHLKAEVRQRLYNVGITERLLFPGKFVGVRCAGARERERAPSRRCVLVPEMRPN